MLLEQLEQDVPKRVTAVADLQGKLVVLGRQEHEASERLERLQRVEPQAARDFRAPVMNLSQAMSERVGSGTTPCSARALSCRLSSLGLV